jgi:tRNA threonylcarbamoyladenosine biosynthesis protein TsaE
VQRRRAPAGTLTNLSGLLYHAGDAARPPSGRNRGIIEWRTPLAELASSSAAETVKIGRRIGRAARSGMVIALEGPLGAGKTTLVKGIAEALGVEEPVTSPTFTIVSEYRCLIDGGPSVLFHIDLFRIGRTEELEELGFDEILAGSGVTVIEWSEKAAAFLPDDVLTVAFSIQPDGQRTLQISGAEP